MWSCARTLKSVRSVQRGTENELVLKLKPQVDLEMLIKFTCLEISTENFTLYASFKEALREKGLSCTQAFQEAREKLEFSIRIPPLLKPDSISFYSIGKRKVSVTHKIQT